MHVPAPRVLHGYDVGFCDIRAAAARHGRDIAELPFAARIMLENIERHRLFGQSAAIASRAIEAAAIEAGAVEDGAVEDGDVAAIVHWQANFNRALPLHPERIILPDSSGLPVLLDLAALRSAIARDGGDPARVEPVVPVDLVVDHSLQVDHAGSAEAATLNMLREFERNGERYRFLKWAAQAFAGIRVFPPGTGIIHQINLERIAEVVMRRRHGGVMLAVPDFVIGGDSHTPMINGLGVLGWGVGGIDLAAAMLGETYVVPCPEMIGVCLIGERRAGTMTTDIALGLTERLRREKVVGGMIEYFGPAVEQLGVPDRATIANMAPEYGATCGLFPVDAASIGYLRQTRSSVIADLAEAYARANALYREPRTPPPHYDRVIEIDIGSVGISVAGPRRPQERMDLAAVAADFSGRLARGPADGGFARSATKSGAASSITDGAIAIAALTSCTNTSNPALMLAAGLVARKARALGLAVPGHVKTSLAPGSRVVTSYLARAGLLADLEGLGFHVIGYGCTTCGGKSGPLVPEMAAAIETDGVVAAAVLSGNRNFEGRIHKQVRANYIMSPPLVVAYALAGRIDVDIASGPVATTVAGRPVVLAELWPTADEIAALLPLTQDAAGFRAVHDAPKPDTLWTDLAAPTGLLFEWDPQSTYLVEPPFFAQPASPVPDAIEGARVLGLFGDALTTDHVSPGGEIPLDSPAGVYLRSLGVMQRNFNSHVGRRCNHEVMARATFANIRIRNRLAGEREGWFTRHHPTREIVSVHEAAMRYARAGTPVIIIAGAEYGTGSSRDWAAKGPMLLGVRAVLAESFERIHRANLIGMGLLPLRFGAGENAASLGLDGTETYRFTAIDAAIATGAPVAATARHDDGRTTAFALTLEVHTAAERRQLRQGGILGGMQRRDR